MRRQSTLDPWLKREPSVHYVHFEIRDLSQLMPGPFKIISSYPASPLFNLNPAPAFLQASPAKKARQQQPATLHQYRFTGGTGLYSPPVVPQSGLNVDNKLNTECFSADHAIYVRGNYGYTDYDDGGECYIAIELSTRLVIGTMSVNECWLNSISVSVSHQRRGVAANLVRLAVLRYKNNFKLPCLGTMGHSKYYLSAAGKALADSCIRQGILTLEQCTRRVPRERLASTCSSDFSD